MGWVPIDSTGFYCLRSAGLTNLSQVLSTPCMVNYY